MSLSSAIDSDKACIIQVDEHPFVTRTSYVTYDRAEKWQYIFWKHKITTLMYQWNYFKESVLALQKVILHDHGQKNSIEAVQ